jgi:hypothetical protein
VQAKLQSLLFAAKAREDIAGFLLDGKCSLDGANSGPRAIVSRDLAGK